jgi:hypothetical protein
MGASRWLTWTPGGANADKVEASPCQGQGIHSGFDGFDGLGTTPSAIISSDAGDPGPSPRATSGSEIIQTPLAVEPSKPSLPGITIERARKHPLFAPVCNHEEQSTVGQSTAENPSYTQNETADFYAPVNCPPLPRGLRLIRYVPRTPPVKLDDGYTSIANVSKFIDSELRELYARLYRPVQIRGGHGVFVILDRLRQVGLEIEIVAGGKP